MNLLVSFSWPFPKVRAQFYREWCVRTHRTPSATSLNKRSPFKPFAHPLTDLCPPKHLWPRMTSLCSETKDCCFLTRRKVLHQFFFKKMILPAVIIRLYCFKLFFEKHLCLNNRPFIISTTDEYNENKAPFLWHIE